MDILCAIDVILTLFRAIRPVVAVATVGAIAVAATAVATVGVIFLIRVSKAFAVIVAAISV